MFSYQQMKFKIMLQSVLLPIFIWVIYYWIIQFFPCEMPTVETVHSYVLSRRLHLMDQRKRPFQFQEIIDQVRRVDASERREILMGPEMKIWFYRLRLQERGRLMEEFLPKPLVSLIHQFLDLPKEEELSRIYEVMEKLFNSKEWKMFQSLSPDQKLQYKKYITDLWNRKGKESLYGLILTLIFDHLNSWNNPDQLNDVERSGLSIFYEVLSDYQRVGGSHARS